MESEYCKVNFKNLTVNLERRNIRRSKYSAEQEEESSRLVTGKIQLPGIADGSGLPMNLRFTPAPAKFTVTVPSLIFHRREVYEKSSSKEN